jgi:hypothetical protein
MTSHSLKGQVIMAGITTPDLLPGVFPSRTEAEAAVQELQDAGFDKEDIGVALVEHGDYRVLNEEAHDILRGLSVGAAIGAPAGVLSGIALLAFVVPGLGTITAGSLVLAASKGLWWGAWFGGWAGLMTKMRWNYEEDRWVDIPLQSGQALVVVRPGHHWEQVHEIMERHGAIWFLDPEQPDHPLHAPPVMA